MTASTEFRKVPRMTDEAAFHLLVKMLTYDPALRIGPFEAISHPFFGMAESAEVQTEAPST